MARLRYNNAVGTLGASLTSSGTTITFASAPSFATITSPDFIPLVLEPAGTSPSGNFEIVYLTAYTAAATTGTIARGQEGTSGVAHSNGVAWEQGPVQVDAYQNYAVFTSSGSWIVPANVTQIRCRAIGGGGGGASASVGTSGTPGSGGGSGGIVIDQMLSVTAGHTLTVTIGAGGSGGTGVSGYGGYGGATLLNDGATTLISADGGGRGAPGTTGGGAYGGQAVAGTWGIWAAGSPGDGGKGGGIGFVSGDVFLVVVGGAGGGACTGTNGGGGGGAQQSSAALASQPSGGSGASGTTSGVNGVTATQPGCGGGGGGAAFTGGTQGLGGAGAAGQLEIWW